MNTTLEIGTEVVETQGTFKDCSFEYLGGNKGLHKNFGERALIAPQKAGQKPSQKAPRIPLYLREMTATPNMETTLEWVLEHGVPYAKANESPLRAMQSKYRGLTGEEMGGLLQDTNKWGHEASVTFPAPPFELPESVKVLLAAGSTPSKYLINTAAFFWLMVRRGLRYPAEEASS